MNRTAIGLLALGAVAGAVIVANLDADTAAEAAAGDLAFAPKTISKAQTVEVCANVESGYVVGRWRIDGKIVEVVMRNGSTTGINLDTGAPITVATPNGLADARNALLKAGGIRAFAELARTSGAIVGATVEQ